MSDDAPKPPAPHNYSALRKAGFIAGAAVLAWGLFGQGIPRLLFPASQPQTIPQPVIPQQEKTEPKEDRSEALERRIDVLEGRIETLEEAQKTVVAAPVPAAAPPVDDKRIAHLEDTITKQNDKLQSMKSELGTLQTGSKQQVAALAALGPLQESVLRGDSFSGPLATLTQLATGNARAQELLAQLQPFADAGAPTLAALQKQFATLLPTALSSNDGGSIVERNLHSLIRIRKVGEQQTGDNDEAILARAEAKLAHGELEAALHETQALSAPATTVFAPWTANAQALLHIRGTLDALHPALMQDAPAATSPSSAPAIAPPLAVESPSAASPATQDSPDSE